jgi:hypothetical protein
MCKLFQKININKYNYLKKMRQGEYITAHIHTYILITGIKFYLN